MQPSSGFCVVSTDERVETPIESEEEESELPLFGIRVEPTSVLQTGDRRFARADDRGELLVTNSDPAGRGE
jgi:hypothetical protein